MKNEPKKGKVFLVGAGPGDIGLITLKAIYCLRLATVVVYDYLVNEELLDFAPAEAERIFAGKKGGGSITQDEINQLVLKKAQQGEVVVRLKGGDPFLLGRGAEEALFLAENAVPFEVVPGLSSALAAPTYAGIAVTHRDISSSVHIFSGHKRETPAGELDLDWRTIAQLDGTLIFLMGVGNLPLIVENLLGHGKDPATPVALIRNATFPEQESLISTLAKVVAEALEKKFQPPVVIVIGECVRLREKLNWLETLPLFGKRILITRPEVQDEEFARLVRACGGTPLLAPVITIVPLEDNKPLHKAIEEIEKYDWLLFASANSIKIFFHELYALGKDVRWLGGIKIATIGRNTARLLRDNWGISADFIPSRFVQEKMAEELPIAPGKKVLIPRAATSRDLLPLVLHQKGAEVDVIPIYEIAPNKEGIKKATSWLEKGKVDVIVFSASSAARFLLEDLPPQQRQQLFQNVLIASIGPITTTTIKEYALPVPIEAPEYTTETLLQEIIHYFKNLSS